MLIETTQQLTDYEGAPIVSNDRPFTARDAIFMALNNPSGSYVPSAQDKADAFRICTAIFAGPTAELSIEDAAFIKEHSGTSVTSALVHGRLCDLLENAAQIPAASENGQADRLA